MARSMTILNLLLLALQFAVTQGAYQIVGCGNIIQTAQVRLHINAAFTAAQGLYCPSSPIDLTLNQTLQSDAVDRLEKDFDKDFVQAAYEPLFFDSDKKRVIGS